MATHRNEKMTWIRRAAEDERGNVTVEAAIWMPLLLGFFLLLVDASMILYNKAQVLRVLQDLNRSLSLRTDEQIDAAWVSQYMQHRLPRLAGKIDFPVPVLKPVSNQPGKNYIVTEMVIPSSQLTAVGALNFLPDLDVRVEAVHLDEYQGD